MHNYTKVIFSILFFELSLLLITLTSTGTRVYYVTEKDYAEVVGLVFLMFFFLSMSYLLHKKLRVIRVLSFNLDADSFSWLAYLAIGVNVLYFIVVDSNIRYIEGGVQDNLLAYLSKTIVNFAFIAVEVKKKYKAKRYDPSIVIYLLWGLSFLSIVDGLANILTISFFLYIMFYQLKYRLLVLIIIPIMLVVGLQVKMGAENSLNTVQILQWTIQRFTINTEQLYTALYDEMFEGKGVDYHWGVVSDQINYSFHKLFRTDKPDYVFKTFSEYLYFTLYGEFNSGSSPGVFLSGLLLGGVGLGWVITYFSLLPLFMYSDSLRGSVSFFDGIILYWIFKGSVNDFPGVLSIVSLSFILYTFTMLVSKVE